MITYKYKVTFHHDRFGKYKTEKIFCINERAKAEREVAEFNCKNKWRGGVYAVIQTIREGSDFFAERAHERVAYCRERDWANFRP